MRTLKIWSMKIASCAAALALIVAVSSSGSVCWFTAYQPDVPESLR